MAYIIPNASDTGSGQRFANVNQAEPDSLDIEALGLRANWIRSGGAITLSSEAVSVAAGVAVINNVPYSFSAYGPVTITRASNARFDLIIARLTAGTVTVTLISGSDSSTNPTLPKSRSVLAYDGLFNSNTHVDPATDVLIGAVYVTAAETTSSNVVDKRVVNPVPITRTAATAPTNSTVDVVGDVVIQNGSVYVKVDSSTWTAMAKSSDVATAGFPVGSIFAWPGKSGSVPGSQYLECNGQSLVRSSYPALFAVIGTTYGANDVNTFNLPNLSDDRTIMGTSVIANYGTNGGGDTYTLTAANIPQHTHSVSVATHPSMSHNATVSTHDGHIHATQQHVHQGALAYRRGNPDTWWNGRHITFDEGTHPGNSYHVDAIDVYEDYESDGYDVLTKDPYTLQPTVPRSTSTRWVNKAFSRLAFRTGSNPDTVIGGNHTHTVTVDAHPALGHTVTETPYGQASPTAVSTVPKHIKMRWYIRVT